MSIAEKQEPQPRETKEIEGPKFYKTLIFLILSPIILGVVSSVLFISFSSALPFPYILIIGEAVLFVALIFFLRSDDFNLKFISRLHPGIKFSTWFELLFGILSGFVIFLLIRVAILPIAEFGQLTYGGFQFQSLIAPPTLGRIIFAGLVAPFVEEFAFRGYGIKGLHTRLGAGWALVITSLFFGIYHFGYGLWGMFQLAVTGLLYGLVFLWRKNITAPIAAHALTNLLLLFFPFV